MDEVERSRSNSCCIETATNNNDKVVIIPPADDFSSIKSECEHDVVNVPLEKGNNVQANSFQSRTPFDLTPKHHNVNEQLDSENTPMIENLDSDNTVFVDKPDSDITRNVEELGSEITPIVEGFLVPSECTDEHIDQTEPFNDDGLALVEGSEETNSLALLKCLDEVGQYAYVTMVAQSLFVLFAYNKWHRSFQESCVKDLLKHLELPEQMENTLMMVTMGNAAFKTMDPFFSTIKKQQYVEKNGMQVILADLLEFFLKTGYYDARSRVLIKFISQCLAAEYNVLDDMENIIAKTFAENSHEPSQEELKDKKRKERNTLIKRVALIGLATVGGGVVIGLTGGLAAPFIAAGAGAVIGGAGSAVLGSAAGIAIIGSVFGVAGAGLTGYKMNKRVGSLKEFEFEPLTCGLSLHLTVAVTGWLSDNQPDIKAAWLCLNSSKEQYVLRYETECLKELGRVFEKVVGMGVSVAVQETLKHTVLSGLLAAITWPATLISVASIIDNPWSVCTQRSVLAGKQLAEVLLARHQGRRPVTLIGYSFGARVIFSCLHEMAKRKNCEGIIEDVIMLGAPVTGDVNDWRAFERVVSGKIVNGYCRTDWLLKFMYRAASVQLSVAGLSPVDWNHRLMRNVDLTEVVTGHLEYAKNMEAILKVIDSKTKDLGSLTPVDSVTKSKEDA